VVEKSEGSKKKLLEKKKKDSDDAVEENGGLDGRHRMDVKGKVPS